MKNKKQPFIFIVITSLLMTRIITSCATIGALTAFNKNTHISNEVLPVDNQLSSDQESNASTSLGSLTLTIPQAIADSASIQKLPREDREDAAWWQKSPEFDMVTLDNYAFEANFHQPQIFIYPAQEYAELVSIVALSIQQLNVINGGHTPITLETLPVVPFNNARMSFASNIQPISFHNGKGVRFLTQYAQYAAPINNHELFYHFQGLTDFGNNYVIAILPILHPSLPDSSDVAGNMSESGIAYPDMTDPNADWAGYYSAVTDLLNNASSESFTPTIGLLDQMMMTMRIND